MNQKPHEPGICPVCGSEDLDYGVLIPYGNSISYPWTCNHCHAKGNEVYDLIFNQHENIVKEDDTCSTPQK